jgi:dTDP-4-amino-4,6-dideoxygalactose transaminase
MRSARTEFLPFHVPEIGQEEIDAVVETLRSGWLTTGPKVRAFEAAFTQYVGVAHAVAVNSCTAALHLALAAIELRPGDEVIVPTFTFAATAEVVEYFKARPVLVDSEPDTLNLDPRHLERCITPRTRAVIPVHFAGQPCDMDAIGELARAHGLAVIEDSAHALPAYYRGAMAGTLGDIGCFSFYATKTITTGEGGMAVTNNPQYADRIRALSLHGISRDAWKRYTAQGSWYYEIETPGFKYNLTDIAASLGLAQLAKCERFLQARRRCAEFYNRAFADLPEVATPTVREGLTHAWHLYVLRLDQARLRIDRAAFIEELRALNIGTSVHFIPLHLHPFYRDTYGYKPQDFPVASAVYAQAISLPIYSRMSEQDLNDVVEAVRDLVVSHRR